MKKTDRKFYKDCKWQKNKRKSKESNKKNEK